MSIPHYVSRVTCHVSHVTCHESPVTCHLSPVTCHMSCVIFFNILKKIGQSGGASWWRVGYQRGLPRLICICIQIISILIERVLHQRFKISAEYNNLTWIYSCTPKNNFWLDGIWVSEQVKNK